MVRARRAVRVCVRVCVRRKKKEKKETIISLGVWRFDKDRGKNRTDCGCDKTRGATKTKREIARGTIVRRIGQTSWPRASNRVTEPEKNVTRARAV